MRREIGTRQAMAGGPVLEGVLPGVGVALVVSVAGAALFGIIISTRPVLEEYLPIGLNVLATLSAVAGGARAGARTRQAGWLNGGLAGAAYILVCFFLGMAFYPAAVPAVALTKSLVLGFLAGAIGGVIGVNL